MEILLYFFVVSKQILIKSDVFTVMRELLYSGFKDFLLLKKENYYCNIVCKIINTLISVLT